MNVLSKYVIKEFFKLLIICQGIFTALYLMIDFTGGIDDFIKADAPKTLMIAYYGYKIPAIAVQMLPVATLTSVIILFSLMKKQNEIVALQASGANVWKISQPIIVTAFFLSLSLFLFQRPLSRTPAPQATTSGGWM